MANGSAKGLLITLEGIEGSGKSTQIQRLEARIRALGLPVTVSKEPGGTALGKDLRRLLLEPHASGERWCPLSELLLFYADRAQHLATLIRPALDRGDVVVVDRFDDSTRAYQGASGVPDALLDSMRDLALGGFRPDLTLILDMDPEVSLRRVETRNAATQGFRETRFDNEALAFHKRIRDRFRAVAQEDPERAWLFNADTPPETLEAAIWTLVEPRLAGLTA
jgi:dTMP kinase